MSFRFRTLDLHHVGVVGSGQIGPDIALHLAKALAPSGVVVTVVDVAPEALHRGRAKLDQKVAKARETGAFSAALADEIEHAVTFTSDYDALHDADFVIEAATENLDVKRRIFTQLEALCAPTAILASNSSHIEPPLIFGHLRHRARALVVHYFFPAERNPLVEIVAGPDTADDLAETMTALYEEMGKVPVRVASRYGLSLIHI